MRVKNQRGSIVFFVSLAAVFVFGLGAVFFYFASSSGVQAVSDPKVIFKELEEQVKQVMANQQSIQYSIEKNPNAFSCLFETKAQCKDRGGVFLLFSKSSAVSQLAKDAGLDKDGLLCKGFPNKNCSFRVEAIWEPVCGSGAYCDNVRSFNVITKIIYDPGADESSDHKLSSVQKRMYSPSLALSQQVQCERGGGVWASVECLSQVEAAQRNVASTQEGGSNVIAPDQSNFQTQEDYLRREQEEMGMPVTAGINKKPAVCPNSVTIQEVEYPVEMISEDRASVNVPAMNGCPSFDVFTFQCTAKSNASFEGEGHWIQVEAAMASACDNYGTPIGEDARM